MSHLEPTEPHIPAPEAPKRRISGGIIGNVHAYRDVAGNPIILVEGQPIAEYFGAKLLAKRDKVTVKLEAEWLEI